MMNPNCHVLTSWHLIPKNKLKPLRPSLHISMEPY